MTVVLFNTTAYQHSSEFLYKTLIDISEQNKQSGSFKTSTVFCEYLLKKFVKIQNNITLQSYSTWKKVQFGFEKSLEYN